MTSTLFWQRSAMVSVGGRDKYPALQLEIYQDANGNVLFGDDRYYAAMDGSPLEKRVVQRLMRRHINEPIVTLCALTRRLCHDLLIGYNPNVLIAGTSPAVALGIAAATGLAVYYSGDTHLFPGRKLMTHARELGVMISVKQLVA